MPSPDVKSWPWLPATPPEVAPRGDRPSLVGIEITWRRRSRRSENRRVAVPARSPIDHHRLRRNACAPSEAKDNSNLVAWGSGCAQPLGVRDGVVDAKKNLRRAREHGPGRRGQLATRRVAEIARGSGYERRLPGKQLTHLGTAIDERTGAGDGVFIGQRRRRVLRHAVRTGLQHGIGWSAGYQVAHAQSI